MKTGDEVRVKVERGLFKAGDVGEFRFEHDGRLYIGGLFLGEIDFAPDEVEIVDPDTKLSTLLRLPGRRFIVFTTVSFVKRDRVRRMLHVERLSSPLAPLAEYPDAAKAARRAIECLTEESARATLEMAQRIAKQHPAFPIDEWHDTTIRALRP